MSHFSILKCILIPFFDYIPIISQIKSLIQLVLGYTEEAKATAENFISLYISLLDPHFFSVSCPEYYCAKPKPCISLPNWMKKLDNSLPVTFVSMPGTHDSGCRIGGTFARCQSWCIGDQLRAGVRSLDIRCRVFRDKFQVMHGIVNCHLMFDTVLKYCEEFLEENPTEFIMMKIRDESAPVYATKSFTEVYKEYAARPVFLKSEKRNVTVEQARGKILVVKRFEGEGIGNEWSENWIVVQDNFEPSSIAAKIEAIIEFYDKASPDREKIHVNYLSACIPLKNLWPRHIARHTNKMMLEILRDLKKRHFGGIVMMDFPSSGLIKEIVNLNFIEKGNYTCTCR